MADLVRGAGSRVGPPTSVLRRLRLRARRFWREYTRMRTAILFLIGVVLIVLVGSFVPQQDSLAGQPKVDQFLADHHNLNDLASAVGLPLTEVFISPLFYILLGSLYIALGACVIRRGRALLVRTLRRYPRTPQYWGEWGSWLFHTSFFLLLVAVVWGKSTGYQGIVTVTEGERVTEARADYQTLQEGRLFNGQHAGYQVQLNSFHASYAPNGEARDYVSNVSVIDKGRVVETRDVRVNDFLGYDNVDFYQQDYGWAPHIVVRNPAGRVVYDGTIQFFSGSGGDKSVQVGVLKVPDFGYTIPGARTPVQIGARLAIFPDAQPIAQDSALSGGTGTTAQFGPGSQVARHPVIEAQIFIGDLGLARGTPQNVDELDTSAMLPYFDDATDHPVPLEMGRSLTLPLRGDDPSTAFTISFPELKQYSLFLVKKDNGVPLVYATFVLIMTGLMAKLYIKPLLDRHLRRRRPRDGTPASPPPAAGPT